MGKYLTISLINELFEFGDIEKIALDKDIIMHKASDIELNHLKQHLDIFQKNSSSLWRNYFENDIIPTFQYNADQICLNRVNWRYTILQHDKYQFSQADLISLKLSLLRLNVLLEKGFELESSGEFGDVVITQDLYSSFNLLIDTEAKYVANGSKKHIRKLPSKNEIADFKAIRKQVRHIFKQQNEYETIIKALTDFNELNQISNISSFKIVAYFSIIESLITHNPKNENYVSISSQLGNKIGLLINNYFEGFSFQDYFKGPDSNNINTIITKLYTYRSDIAHGNIPKFEKELKIIEQNIDRIQPFMEMLLFKILRFSIEMPNLILDLKKC